MDPLANLCFARHDVRLMTDEADVVEKADNLPTKDNIVRRPCELSFLHLHFLAGCDEGISL